MGEIGQAVVVIILNVDGLAVAPWGHLKVNAMLTPFKVSTVIA